jgi:PAS domain S-box-containing protein
MVAKQKRRTQAAPDGQGDYLAALHEATLALARHLDPVALLGDLLVRAAALVGTSHGCIELIEPGATSTIIHKNIGAFEKYTFAVNRGEGIIGRAWETGELLVVANYRSWPGRLPDPMLDELCAILAIPLKSGEQVTAVLCLAHVEEGRTFAVYQIDLLARFAQLASVALDNARFHAALRNSEARFRAAIDGSLDSFFMLKSERDDTGKIIDFVFVDMNRNAENFATLPRDQIIGQRIGPLTQPPALRATLLAKYVQVVEDGVVLEEEFSIPAQGLQARWLHHQIVPLADGIAVTLRDITERKQAEEALTNSTADLDRQKQTLDAILSATPDHFSMWDRDRRYVYVNDSGLEAVGLRLEDVIGKTWQELNFPEDVGKRFDRQFDEILRTGLPIRSETEFPSVRGPRYYESVHTPIRDKDGHIVSIVATHRDITERKQAETAEREQGILAQALRDTAAVLTSTLDPDLVMNRILENVGRVVPHDCANIMLIEGDVTRVAYWRNYPAHFDEFFKTFRLPLDSTGYRKLIASNSPDFISDTATSDRWGKIPETRWVRSHATAPLRSRGQVIGFLNLDSATPGFFTAIHAERLQAFADQAAIAIENAQLYEQVRRYAFELEERVAERTVELTAANERLRDLDRLKSKFVQDISHELRTPIANLNLRLHLLERDRSDKQAEHLSALRRYVDQLMDITGSVLDFMHLGLGEAKVTFGPVDLNMIVEQVITAQEPHALAAGLRLVFEPETALPPVWGEANQLTRLVNNLLRNAINYTPNGEVRVSIDQDTTQDEVCLTVRDTGIGIDAQDMPYVFEHFYRGSAVSELNPPGAGLGLGIVKQIVGLHNGRIEVASQARQGSTFRVWLPLAGTRA